MGSAKETETKPAPASTFETPDTEVDKTIDEGVEVSDANEEKSGYVVVRARPSSPTSRLVSFQDWRDGVDTWMAKSDAWREQTDDKLKALTDVILETRELVRSLCCVAREETRASKSLDTGNPPEIKEDDDEEGDKEESDLRKSLKVLKKLIGQFNGLNDSDGDEEDDGSGKRKEDEEDDDEEESELRKSLKVLKKFIRRSNGLNDSDGDEVDGGSGKRKDDEEDDDEEDDEDEASDCSPAKLAAGKSCRGTPTSKLAKGKRKNGDDTKPASGSALKKIKDVKAGGGSQITPSSAQGMDGASSAQGPVKEEEIRAVLLQRSPLPTSELVAIFKARLKSPENKKAFAEILKRITKMQKMSNNQNYIVLRK